MDHPFQPSITDSSKCIKCKRDTISHTDLATCETCDNIGSVKLLGDIACCSDCYNKEIQATIDYQSPDKQAERLENSQLLRAKSIDAQVQLISDIFNAETVAIVDIKDIIDKDPSITNKPYALASMLTERYLHFKKAIFEMDEKKIELHNKQRAIHTYLNNLANQLRVEEREKLKISDINYQPSAPKLTTSRVTPKKKAFDKVELAKYAGEAGLPLATFQMLCVQRNLSPEMMAKVFLENASNVLTPAKK